MSNPFKNRLSRKFIFGSFIGILLAGVAYMIILPFVLNFNVEERNEIWKKLSIVVPLFDVICTFIFYILYRSAEKVITKVDMGISPTDEEIIKARKSLTNMNTYYMIVGILFYPLGTVVNTLSDLLHNNVIHYDVFLFRLILSALWGMLAGVLTVRINNISLIQSKLKLNIFELEKSSGNFKFESLIKKFLIPIALLLTIILTFSATSFYFIGKENVRNKNIQIKEILDKAKINKSSIEEIENYFDVAEKKENYFTQINYGNFIKITIITFFIMILILYLVLYEYRSHVINLISQIEKLTNDNIDLSKRINIISFDDIGIMTSGINKIITNLLDTFKSIKISSNEVYQSSKKTETKISESKESTSEIKNIIAGFEDNTNSQIASIKSTTNQFQSILLTIDNFIKLINIQIDKVENTSGIFKDMIKGFNIIDNDTDKNRLLFNELIKSIENGNNNVEESIESIKEINESGKKINEIADIITNISSQTDLLAMNASIEAAHAGEAGKGFAVVADEIRKLSESTSESAKNITMIIKNMNEKISSGSEIFITLKSIFEIMNTNMNMMQKSVDQISQSTRSYTKKATDDLIEINNLLEISNRLKKETESLNKNGRNIENSITLLDNNSEEMKNNNEKLTNNIKELIQVFDITGENFKTIFINIKELDKKISTYKTE